MPNDTKYIVNGAQLTDIGAAIRSKLGEQDTYTVDEMPGKISEISGGAGVSGNIEITENGENINVAQYATATVNVAGGDTKVIVPEQTVDAPRTGRVAIEGVDVSGLTVGDRLAVKLEGEAYGQQISNYTDAVFLHTNYDIISRAIPMDMNGATVTINIMIKDHDAGDQWGLSIYIGGVQTAFPGVTISARAW